MRCCTYLFQFFFVISLVFALPNCPFHILQSKTDTSVWENEIPYALNASDPLVQLNNILLAQYNIALEKLSPDPVIIQEKDYIVLFQNNSRVKFTFTPPLFHSLKMVSHIPLAIFTIILPEVFINNPAHLSSETLSKLSNYQSMMHKVNLNNRFETQSQYDRAQRIMENVHNFLDELILRANHTVSLQELHLLAQKCIEDINLNINDAAQAQVFELHSVITKKVRPLLTTDEWNRMKIAVVASHMAEPDNLVSQYFSRLFEVPIHYNTRFYTLDGIDDELTSFKLITTHVVDYAISEVFFNDTFFMHRDILADGARIALNKIFDRPLT